MEWLSNPGSNIPCVRRAAEGLDMQQRRSTRTDRPVAATRKPPRPPIAYHSRNGANYRPKPTAIIAQRE